MPFTSDKTQDILQTIYQHLGYTPIIHLPFSGEQLYRILLPYFSFLQEKLEKTPYIHLKIVWNIFSDGQSSTKDAFLLWFETLENAKLVEPDFGENIKRVLALYQLSEEMDLTEITKTDFDQWLLYLDHPNPALRGVAAKCIGSVYTDWQTDDDEFQGGHYIPIIEMLEILYKKQVEGKNVVGGFIDGCCVDGTLKELSDHNKQLKFFDVDGWLIKTAIDSSENEPYIPGSQAFWFYLHEYFDWNADACHRLLDGKQHVLVAMCTFESLDAGSYEVMKLIWERLQHEAPLQLAEAVGQVIEEQSY